MMKSVKKNNKNIRVIRSMLYLFVLLIQVSTMYCSTIPRYTDDLNPLAFLFYMRGDDWSKYLLADGYYYKYGQLFFYFPLALLFQNPNILYKAILFVNIAISSTVVLCVFELLYHDFKCKNLKKCVVVSFIIAIMPMFMMHSKQIWAEPILIVIPWVLLIIMLRCMEAETVKKAKIYSGLLAVVAVYSYMLHSRGCVLLIAVLCSILFTRKILKNKNIHIWIWCIVTCLLLTLDRFLTISIKAVLYSDSNNLTGGSIAFFFEKEFWSSLLSKEGILNLLQEVLGWCFASVASTYGILALGIIISLSFLLKAVKKKEYDQREMLTILFFILYFCGSLFLGTFFFYSGIQRNVEGLVVRRGDALVYTRYLDGANAGLSFIGIYFWIVKRKVSLKKWIISLCTFSFLLLYYGAEIAWRIEHTVTWSVNTSTINYFFDFSKVFRSGGYSNVEQFGTCIIWFGCLSLFVYVLFFLLQNREKIAFGILIAILISGYYWNTYNCFYHFDQYLRRNVEQYESVIRLVEDDNDMKNIYLDDEILRSAFQYYYDDYYIVTRRDDNRFGIDNMIMISYQGEYNKDLCEDDYYEILTDEGTEKEYHIYFKGSKINLILQNAGYETRKVGI